MLRCYAAAPSRRRYGVILQRCAVAIVQCRDGTVLSCRDIVVAYHRSGSAFQRQAHRAKIPWQGRGSRPFGAEDRHTSGRCCLAGEGRCSLLYGFLRFGVVTDILQEFARISWRILARRADDAAGIGTFFDEYYVGNLARERARAHLASGLKRLEDAPSKLQTLMSVLRELKPILWYFLWGLIPLTV